MMKIKRMSRYLLNNRDEANDEDKTYCSLDDKDKACCSLDDKEEACIPVLA